MSAKQIIIPKGTVGPNDTLIIDIPATPMRRDLPIVARRLNYSSSSPRRNYSQAPTRVAPQMDSTDESSLGILTSRQMRSTDGSSDALTYDTSYVSSVGSVRSADSRPGPTTADYDSFLGISRATFPGDKTPVARRLEYPPTPPSFRQNRSQASTRGSNVPSSRMNTTDGSSLGILASSQMNTGNRSPARNVVNQRTSRSDFNFSQRLTSPQRRVQSTSSIYEVDNQDVSQFEPPIRAHIVHESNNPNLTSSFAPPYTSTPRKRNLISYEVVNPNATYEQSISQFTPPYTSTPTKRSLNLTYDVESPDATYTQSTAQFAPSRTSTPRKRNLNLSYEVVNPNATYEQPISQFAPPYTSTPTRQHNPNLSSDFTPRHTSTPTKVKRKLSFHRVQTPEQVSEELTEEESFESSEGDDSMISSGVDEAPIATTRTKITKTIETPQKVSQIYVETEENEEPSNLLDSSEERMNDSILGQVIAGNMGRRLVFPTPPGQPSGTGRVVHLGGNNLSPDRKSVKFKSTNSGINFYANQSRERVNATYNKSGTTSGNRSLMMPVEMVNPNQTYDVDLSYEDFLPTANSSELDLRGNQTYNVNEPNRTYNASYAELENLEAREQELFDSDLRNWQKARRKFIYDTTKLSTNASAASTLSR